MSTEAANPAGVPETDIIFNCTYCQKSLSIDQRGAGLMITCPDCGKRIQVPEIEAPGPDATVPAGDDSDRQIVELAESLATSQTKVQELVQNLQEMNGRREYLEHLRVENLERLDRVGRELTIIQAAIDRIVAVLQDAGVNNSGPAE